MDEKEEDLPKRPRVWPKTPMRGTQLFGSIGIMLPVLVLLIVLAVAVVRALILRAIHP